jgi:uncharacterized glyoxalase superfamily protein PhnB
MRMKRMTPMRNVADTVRSWRFYQEIADFDLRSPREAVEHWRWAYIQSGDCELMLSESGGPTPQLAPPDAADEGGWPVIYYVYPEDVVALHGELREKGFAFSDPRVTFDGLKEFEVRDPDGHRLWFGQETEETPTGGRPGRAPR